MNNILNTDKEINGSKLFDKKISLSNIEYQVKFSFNITYILLLTTATITFIEAIRTLNPHVRHILNLETCISVIAGYFYSTFIKKINKTYDNHQKVDWSDFTKTRYIDWFITTPLMLLALSLVLSENIGVKIKLHIILSIVLLNYTMLYIGFIGEMNKMNKINCVIGGFVAFVLMYYIIYFNFVKPKYKLDNYILFGFYFIVWSMYGIVYLLDEEYKNIGYNILDLIAKCFIGLGLWCYYTKIIVLK
jgi:bacteriorhodopsin